MRAVGHRPGSPRLVRSAAARPASQAGPARCPAPWACQGAATVLTRAMTITETAGLPAVTDLATAARALGLGRNKAYQLASAGQFPCPVFRAGNTWKVPTAGLLTLLGLPVPGPVQAAGTDHQEPRPRPAEPSARSTPALQQGHRPAARARRRPAAGARRSAR